MLCQNTRDKELSFLFPKKLFVKPEKELFVFPEVPIEMRADGQLNQSIRSPSTGRKCPPDKSRRNNRSIERNVFFLFFCFLEMPNVATYLSSPPHVCFSTHLVFSECWCCNFTENLFDEYHFNENNVTNHNGKWTIDRNHLVNISIRPTLSHLHARGWKTEEGYWLV